MPELIISEDAVLDVVQQAAYYRDQGSPDTASRWLIRTRKTFAYVAAHPEMGEEVRPGLRASRVEKFKRHAVYYHSTAAQVVIVRVLHGAADLDAALGP